MSGKALRRAPLGWPRSARPERLIVESGFQMPRHDETVCNEYFRKDETEPHAPLAASGVTSGSRKAYRIDTESFQRGAPFGRIRLIKDE